MKQGLKPLKEKKWYEKQDYSHKATFGSFDISQLPSEYLLVSEIKNQGSTNKCTAFASCAIQESQHPVKFDEDWYYYQEGIVNGEQSDEGYDLRTCMSTGVKKGFRVLGVKDSENDYKESSYFRVDDPFNYTDLFDDIRVALWLAKEEKRCVCTGVNWRDNWNAKDGIIPDGGNPVGGHCIKICGWKTINGKLYLVAQNSYGESFGDKGLNYFSREIVNSQLTYGAFAWRSSLSPEEIQKFSKMLSLIKSVLSVMLSIITLGKL